jgi:GST-like protein
MRTEPRFRLYQRPGWGSAIIEAQLAWYGMAVELIAVGDVLEDAAARRALAAVNPLAQIPTLVLASGEAMTESAAMTLYLADVAGSDALVPGPGAAERAGFLRWLVFIVANIYPCFTFADVPTRFVPEAEADAFEDRVGEHAQRLWKVFATSVAETGGPWALGRRLSALDIYIAVMTRWGPGPDWFAAETPALSRIARDAAALPAVAPVMVRNFP